MLFSGTVRTNLDPFSKHTDAQLWESLGHVNLKVLPPASPVWLLSVVRELAGRFAACTHRQRVQSSACCRDCAVAAAAITDPLHAIAELAKRVL